MDSVVARYMPQLQWYMWLSITDNAYLSVFFGNRRWEYVFIQKDWDYITRLRVLASEFWAHVRDDTEPTKPNVKQLLDIDHIPIDDMVSRDATKDNHFGLLESAYLDTQDKAKEFEDAKKELKAIVKPNERKVYTKNLIITRDKRGSLRISIPKTESENTDD